MEVKIYNVKLCLSAWAKAFKQILLQYNASIFWGWKQEGQMRSEFFMIKFMMHFTKH